MRFIRFFNHFIPWNSTFHLKTPTSSTEYFWRKFIVVKIQITHATSLILKLVGQVPKLLKISNPQVAMRNKIIDIIHSICAKHMPYNYKKIVDQTSWTPSTNLHSTPTPTIQIEQKSSWLNVRS